MRLVLRNGKYRLLTKKGGNERESTHKKAEELEMLFGDSRGDFGEV